MAHGWVYEGMGLASGRKETGLAVWCFVLCGSSTLCVVPPFGTHHPLCLHTSHSNQPPLDGVVRWCESTTVPLSISLFTVCKCEWQETRVVMVTMKAPSHSIAITNTTTTSMSTICAHTHLSGLLGLVAHHMHHGVCGMTTIATSTPLLPHTHSHSEEGDGKRDSGFTPPHNTIKWWLVGVAGVQAKWMMSAKKEDHTQRG